MEKNDAAKNDTLRKFHALTKEQKSLCLIEFNTFLCSWNVHSAQ